MWCVLQFATINLIIKYKKTWKKIFMVVFFDGWSSTASRLQSLYMKGVYFLPRSSQKFLALTWITCKGWMAESTWFHPLVLNMGPVQKKLMTAKISNKFKNPISCPFVHIFPILGAEIFFKESGSAMPSITCDPNTILSFRKN